MFVIKQATTADIPLINKLAWNVFPETYKNILSHEQIEYMMDWMYSIENLHKQMEEEGHIYYIAYEECEAAGYVSIRQEDTDLFHLEKIYVIPYYQKYLNPEKPDVPLNKNDAFQKVQKRHVQEKR